MASPLTSPSPSCSIYSDFELSQHSSPIHFSSSTSGISSAAGSSSSLAQRIENWPLGLQREDSSSSVDTQATTAPVSPMPSPGALRLERANAEENVDSLGFEQVLPSNPQADPAIPFQRSYSTPQRLAHIARQRINFSSQTSTT